MTNKIMLVDSCNFDLIHTAYSLETDGYSVCKSTSDTNNIIKVALAESPDIIFLDYDNEGLATCQALQANKMTNDIPVIIMSSAKKNKESTMLALKFGCIDFIHEGDKDVAILSKLRTYLRLAKIKSICRVITNKL